MHELFHPSVVNWFTKSFSTPTDVQLQAWRAIREQKHTLIAAPTGSGKTLAAFLSAIDELIRESLEGRLQQETRIVYISPLKALSNDIEKNLQRPLAGIADELMMLGLPSVDIRTSVRTGDTPASERTAMTKRPPHILVTTPESLFLLLTSENGRKMLSTVRSVIVDEIHALVRDKRGSHLSLSLERLDGLADKPSTRIGISATQKPIDLVAQFLTGVDPDGSSRPCTIIDTGHRRQLDLAVEVPRSPLTAVMATEVWEETYERLVELIHEHRTTLIFVNTRRLAERLAHQLTERLGADVVTAHHGSMSKEHRHDAEQRLKAGSLRALIATASLELGIDIGSVDLVCQIGSARAISTFLQRVGRSGHSIHGTPKGRIFPLTLDELVEVAALMDAVRHGELDRIVIPEKPFDILAQQIVAETSAREFTEDELYDLVHRSFPFRNLSREEFDSILTMLADGFTTRRGRRGAYVHHDMVNRRVRARRNARLAAIQCGGTIPDNFDYDVILEPTNTFLGTLNEDFAIESSVGDIFQLGNSSWMITRVENGSVRVVDAGSAPPSIPFWLGEAPGRSAELSVAVSRLRKTISELLGDDFSNGDASWKTRTIKWCTENLNMDDAAAEQIVNYLAAGKAALGAMPTQETIVMERFFDEAGDMHLVIHSTFGSRMNRAWGLSLRKRFCRKFNFELQAAATEDALVLSLGSMHSFPLHEVYSYLNSSNVRDILIQAVFDSPMFEVRWRWNASRALAMLRRRDGKRVPPQLQRMAAQDLVALIFPDQLACLENIAGDRDVPDHPLINQTIDDCLTEAMDVHRLENLLRKMESGQVEMLARDLREPSPLSQEILNARPYAFLDDAPLEERRTRAVANRRWVDPQEAATFGQLDPDAIEEVQRQAWPDARNADELHEALVLLGAMTVQEMSKFNRAWLEELTTERRVARITNERAALWIAVERAPQWLAIWPGCYQGPALPERIADQEWTTEKALVEIVRGRLEGLGPVISDVIAQSLGLPVEQVDQALIALEVEGFVFRGQFHPSIAATEWCERRLLARIHRTTLDKLRKEIEPVSASDFMRFLFVWHRVEPEQRLEGPAAIETVVQLLEGCEAPAVAWEGNILPSRIADYDHQWLDMACLSGKISWGRFRERSGRGGAPVKNSPMTLVFRQNVESWLVLSDNTVDHESLTSAARRVLEALESLGACFYDDIVAASGLLKSQVEDGLAELVGAGLVTSDSFSGLRALLVPSKYKTNERRHESPFTMSQAGRWSPLRPRKLKTTDVPVEFFARVLLRRYGVVFRRLADRESLAPPWRELVKIYRTVEARGEIRGGRFVDGVWGEQFALPEAVTQLRAIRREEKSGKLVSLCAADPIYLEGILAETPRIASLPTNRALYRDGEVIAVLESGETKFMKDVPQEEMWKYQTALVQKHVPPKLRVYLGKGVGMG